MLSNFRKKQKGGYYKKALLVVAVLVLFGISAALVAANINMYRKKSTLNNQVQSLEKKISDLKTKNEKLQQGITQSDEDHYIEKVAREELDLQKPGEQVVSFIVPEVSVQAEATAKENIAQVWLGWVGGWFK